MQHIDSEGKGLFYGFASDFHDLPRPDFGLLNIPAEWKDGILLLRRTSFRSGAPWCTEPPLGSLPRATAPCSTRVTSHQGSTTRHTYRWLPTQVSRKSTKVLTCFSAPNGGVSVVSNAPIRV
ncbi:hypothetical protein XENOCAPTIV_020488, partial [Xenoophorus captivus]